MNNVLWTTIVDAAPLKHQGIKQADKGFRLHRQDDWREVSDLNNLLSQPPSQWQNSTAKNPNVTHRMHHQSVQHWVQMLEISIKPFVQINATLHAQKPPLVTNTDLPLSIEAFWKKDFLWTCIIKDQNFNALSSRKKATGATPGLFLALWISLEL